LEARDARQTKTKENKNNQKKRKRKKGIAHVGTPAARPQSFQSCLITCPVIGKSPHN
jgi:hypothetical protein